MAGKSPMDNISNSPQFNRFMKQVAIMGGGLLLVGLILRLAGVHFNDALFTVAFGTLAIVALFLGRLFPYRSKDGNESADTRLRPIWFFAMRLSGYTLAVLLMGALFALMHWPGGRMILMLGALAAAGCALAWLYFLILKNKHYTKE